MEQQAPGIVKVVLMGQANYQFSLDYPDHLRLIHLYGSEHFSKKNRIPQRLERDMVPAL